jgi:hypothetical protein
VSAQAVQDEIATEVKRTRIETLVNGEVARKIVDGLQTEGLNEGTISYFLSDVFISLPSESGVRGSSMQQVAREERWGDYLIDT